MGNDLMLRSPAHWPHFSSGDDLSGANDHDHFYVRAASGRYFDFASEVGLADSQLTRGIAMGDVDGDGRLDFLTANQWGDSFLFRNLSESTGAFLGLHVLEKVSPGATAISAGHARQGIRAYPAFGARVTVYLPDGRKLVKEVDGGNGHSGKSSPDVHFGLGAVDQSPLHVSFDWRDRQGRVQHYDKNLMPGWHTVQLVGLEK